MKGKNAPHGRRIIGACLTALLLFLTTGCGKPAPFDGSRITDEKGFRMEYSVLSREETAELELKEGDLLRVEISHTSGNADILISMSGTDPIYRGTKQENASFVLTVPADGVYRISVTGHQASGNVSFLRESSDEH